MSGLDFLDLVLQSSEFHSECCSLLQFDIFCLRGPCSVVTFVVLWFHCFVLLAKIGNFYTFFQFEIFKRFLCESHVFGRSFFGAFCWYFRALNLCLHVVALAEPVTMSEPAKNLWKLNMSRLHYLVLVLQFSNSFDLNSLFFKIYLV